MEGEERRLFTLEEVSRMTGYSKEDLRRKIETGDLATTGEGTADDYRVSRIELERWWNGVEQKERNLFSDEEDG